MKVFCDKGHKLNAICSTGNYGHSIDGLYYCEECKKIFSAKAIVREIITKPVKIKEPEKEAVK